jgi:CRISPR-associated protein Csy1
MAKQLYWPTGDNPDDDTGFHLLAPLYASSLAHRVYLSIQDDRFSDEAKTARQARRDGEFSERPVREYPQLAVQQLGGTKPQNISQLNSERLGQNFLLASQPPQWHSRDVLPLLRTDSLFKRFGRRPEVRQTVKALHTFLAANPPKNVGTRDTRDDLADGLIDEFLLFGAALRELPPGWSQAPECELPDEQKVWVDSGAFSPENLPLNWADELAARYALWLNAALSTTDAMTMGDPEHAHWRNDLRDALAAYDWELRHAA